MPRNDRPLARRAAHDTSKARAASAASPSPPTARVVQILEHLARHATPQSASSIARAVGHARATCGLVLDELVTAGWLVRGADGYSVGVGVVPVARRALNGPGAGALAREPLLELANDLDLTCTTTTVIRDHIVVVDEVEPGRPQVFGPRTGQRYRMAAPAGLFHVAWEPDAVVEEWLARAPRPLTADEGSQIRTQIADLRARGFIVMRLSEPLREVTAVLEAVSGDQASASIRGELAEVVLRLIGVSYTATELRGMAPIPVSSIGAPVFDAAGRQQFMLGALVMRSDMTPADASVIARRVREAADGVTAVIGGVDPWASSADNNSNTGPTGRRGLQQQ